MRMKDVIGKVVISADTGERGGRVEDVLLDTQRHAVAGLLVTDGLLSKQRVVPFADVQTIGADAVIVATHATSRQSTEWLREGGHGIRSSAVHGKDVFTADGARLGSVHDLVADARTGRIVSVEISAGVGRSRLRRPAAVFAADRLILANDVIVVPNAIAATRERHSDAG